MSAPLAQLPMPHVLTSGPHDLESALPGRFDQHDRLGRGGSETVRVQTADLGVLDVDPDGHLPLERAHIPAVTFWHLHRRVQRDIRVLRWVPSVHGAIAAKGGQECVVGHVTAPDHTQTRCVAPSRCVNSTCTARSVYATTRPVTCTGTSG